jgi:hypothetical protein
MKIYQISYWPGNMLWFLSNSHQMNSSKGDGSDLYVPEEIRSTPPLEEDHWDSVAILLSS